MPLTAWSTTKIFSTVQVPTLIVGAENDTIAFVASHSIPFYTSLPSSLDKAYAELNGASHPAARCRAVRNRLLLVIALGAIAVTAVLWLRPAKPPMTHTTSLSSEAASPSLTTSEPTEELANDGSATANIESSPAPSAAVEAAVLLERYDNYSKAQRQTYPPGVAPATEEAAIAQLDGLHALRVAHFGAHVAQAFYGAEEALARSLIELMRLEKNQGLTMEEKAARAQQLYDTLPELARVQRSD